MKKISILGSGWLGKPLATFLVSKGFAVKGSTTSVDKLAVLESCKIKPFLVDISSDKEYEEFLNSDILIVAITSKDVDGFKNLISKICKSTIQKVIFISSTSVYGSPNKEVTEEDEVLKTPLVEIENVFKETTFFDTTIIRFSGLFGGDRQPANWFKNGRKIPQPKGFVNLIHQEDCIKIIYEVIHQNCWNMIFNACCNHHPTRKEFYTKVKLKNGFKAPVFEENENYEWKIISSKKLQNTLGYTFVYDDLFAL